MVGAHLALVDAYATTAFALGERGLAWIEDQPDVEAVAVDWDGTIRATSTGCVTDDGGWVLRAEPATIPSPPRASG